METKENKNTIMALPSSNRWKRLAPPSRSDSVTDFKLRLDEMLGEAGIDTSRLGTLRSSEYSEMQSNGEWKFSCTIPLKTGIDFQEWCHRTLDAGLFVVIGRDLLEGEAMETIVLREGVHRLNFKPSSDFNGGVMELDLPVDFVKHPLRFYTVKIERYNKFLQSRSLTDSNSRKEVLNGR